MKEVKNVAIIGVGLIGGSLGLTLRSTSNLAVTGIGRDPKKLEMAVNQGAIDKYTTSIEAGVKDADIVFVATPVSVIIDMVEEAIGAVKPDTIITDVGSTKASIVEKVEEVLPENVHFIGGHPMAGSEQQGVEAATDNLFRSSLYILTPTPKTNTEAYQKLHSLITNLGARVIAIGPEKHDKLVAAISHLPHLVSAGLIQLASEKTEKKENLLLLAASGFRDMTRIAASNPEVWVDICFENDKAILDEVSKFQEELENFSELIQKKDREKLSERLTEARRIRRNLTVITPEKEDLYELSIPIKDKPGVISEITLATGEIGINIEDIQIVPLTEKSGVLKLVVFGKENAKSAALAIKKKGYKAEIV